MAGSLPQNRGNRSTDRVGATVSRRLRNAGFNVSPSDRKHLANGLFVSGAGRMATITVDFGIPEKNQRVKNELIAELLSWPQVTSSDDVTWEVVSDHDCVILVWVRYGVL